jgi:hypothetical protein
MIVQGLPQNFWVVMKPTPICNPDEICFLTTWKQLVDMNLPSNNIHGVFGDATVAQEEALSLVLIRNANRFLKEVVGRRHSRLAAKAA